MSADESASLLKQQIHERSDLPTLPNGIVHLLKALNNNDISFDQLAMELERFPSIAIKIVAIANSAWASPQTPVTTLPTACSRIGLNIVRSVSIALSISQVFDSSRCPAFSTKTFWISALLNAESAFMHASDDPRVCDNSARFSGLLHNIGLLWLASEKPVETNDALLNTINNPDDTLAESLHERLGMDYYTIGGELAKAMDMPLSVVDAISTETTQGLDSKNALIKNNSYAKLITTAVLQYEGESELDTGTTDITESPLYISLAEKFPKIQSMAESILAG